MGWWRVGISTINVLGRREPRDTPEAPDLLGRTDCIHVLLLLDQFPKVLGGGERIVLRTAALLQSVGVQVSIMTFAIKEEANAALQNVLCPIHVLPLTGVFQVSAVRAAWQLGRFLRQERVTIVQTYFESSNLFGGIVTKALSRAKLVWNFRDMGILRDRKNRLAYRLLRWLPDAVIAVSEKVRRHAIDVDGINPRCVIVIHNGLDLQRRSFHSEDAYPAEQIIVTLGNIRPIKGHDTLIEAAALVLQHVPAVRFVVAGDVLDAEFFVALQNRVNDLGIAERVSFPGLIANPEHLFRGARIFVLPSRSEGFSNAILEAMAAALPVVATAVGGNAEAVMHGETGLIVPPNDPAALAQALLELLDHPKVMRSMGQAGRSRVEAVFTSQAMLLQMTGLYEHMLA